MTGVRGKGNGRKIYDITSNVMYCYDDSSQHFPWVAKSPISKLLISPDA